MPSSDEARSQLVFSGPPLTSMVPGALGGLLLAALILGAWVFLVTAIAIGYYLGKYLAGEVRKEEEYVAEERR